MTRVIIALCCVAMEQCHGPVRGNVRSLDAVVDALQDMGIEFISEKDRVGVILNEA